MSHAFLSSKRKSKKTKRKIKSRKINKKKRNQNKILEFECTIILKAITRFF